MSELTQLEFCGYLCTAARRLNIYISHSETPQGHEYMFGDLAGGRFISGRRKAEKKDALESACQELQGYLCTT